VAKAPTAGAVAIGALASVVIGLAMASRTVGEARVVEPAFCPIAGIMAVGALPSIMIDWRMGDVAVNAVG
jgi:hypothetical protein